MNIVCKRAEQIHAQQIYYIESDTFSDAYSLNSVQDSLSSSLYGSSVVAELDGRVVAYILATDVAGEAEIQRIAVAPGCRHKGIGSAVLEYYIESCRNNGISCIHLEVRKSNVAAISLYTGHGFVQVGIRKAYYADKGEDAILYTLTLQ